ncbi:MAG: hypothetical protein H7831_18905 [Magnetococcus sp. WYHC-3]
MQRSVSALILAALWGTSVILAPAESAAWWGEAPGYDGEYPAPGYAPGGYPYGGGYGWGAPYGGHGYPGGYWGDPLGGWGTPWGPTWGPYEPGPGPEWMPWNW